MASILMAPDTPKTVVRELQAKDIAVLTTGEPRDVMRGGFDGLHIDAHEGNVAETRAALGHQTMLGAYCGASRDLAMQAGEAGVDYVALDQAAQRFGEPVIGWWADLFEIPCVAFVPAGASDLDKLLPQRPDFIRPSDAMWQNQSEARKVIGELTVRMGQ